jgi:hypothetical protein
VESGGSSVGKVRECDVVSRHLQGCSSRLYRLRADGLPPMSKYWTYRSYAGDMSTISLIVCCQLMFGLSALLLWLCWKRNWGESHGPLSRAERWSREHFFSGAVHPSNPVDNSQKVTIYGPREICMVKSHTQTEREKRVTVVGFFTAGCTSIRIIATLGYE